MNKGLKGCAAYECFGAGQKVAQTTFCGRDWQKDPGFAEQMFEVFPKMRHLHELLWYLAEALVLQAGSPIHGKISSALIETERLTYLSPGELLKIDLAAYHTCVNDLLLQVSELVRAKMGGRQDIYPTCRKTPGRGSDLIGADLRNTDLRCANLRGAYLIAADLRGSDLKGTDFIGADLRDADLGGADLTESLFLTQAQINAAKGDGGTRLPPWISRPAHWPVSKRKFGGSRVV